MTDELKKKKNKEKCQYRRDKIKHATPTDLSAEDKAVITQMEKVARQMSISTGIKYQVDHIVPLDAGGLHMPDNLQIITEEQNKSKGSTITRTPLEGAILAQHVRDDMIRNKGKFVAGVSGNPNGRPKNSSRPKDPDVEAEELKLTKLFYKSGGDIDKFNELLFKKENQINLPLPEISKALQGMISNKFTKQKTDKIEEKPVTKVEVVLTTNEEYAAIIKKYEE